MQRDLVSQSTSRSSTPVRTFKDDAKGKSSKNRAHTVPKRSVRDAFHDVHVLELKEAAERRAQKNAIRLKELELQEKRHAAKVKKMEMDAEIQKAQLSMLSNMANIFTLGRSATAPMGGTCSTNLAEPGPSTQLGGSGSTTTESWVHSQQQASMSSGSGSESSQTGALPGLTHNSDSGFNFSLNDFHFPSSWKPRDDML